MSKYDFALQWLDYLGVEVYNQGERILKYKGDPQYEIEPLDAGIRLGEDFGDEEEEEDYQVIGYPDLENLGFVVVSESNPDYFWKPYQRVYYQIKRKRRHTFGIPYESYRKTASQTNMRIVHDPPNRRLRLQGENVLADNRLRVDAGIGPWIYYDEDAPRVVKSRKKKALSMTELKQMMKSRMPGYMEEEEDGFLNINEIPVLMSDEKYIVCMPKMNECQRILINGMSGYGKTVMANALHSQIFYKYEDRVGWIIDPLGQLYDISAEQDFETFNKMNALINNTPRPIPALQLYLANKPVPKIRERDSVWTLSLPFNEFLYKMAFYTYGIKDYDLGGARRYLTEFINHIKHAKKGSDIKTIMEGLKPDWKKDKQMQAMLYKWQATFESIFKEKFTSNMYTGYEKETHELTVKLPDGKEMKGHPFVMAMMAGLVPVINCAMVRRQKWFRNYLADVIQKIVKHQIETPEDERKRLWISTDELNEIYEVSSGKKKDSAATAIEELFRQGRFNKIGFIGNTQSLEKLNPEMYKNATHIMCVHMRSAKERRIIQETFGVEKEVVDQILNLKKLEVMIFSKEPFVIYDRWGRRRVIDDRRWFKGKIFPPINYSKSPK